MSSSTSGSPCGTIRNGSSRSAGPDGSRGGPAMFEVIQPGLETSIQDYPGRIGYWNQGFPPSGPMDSWSVRLANLLVGNEPGAAGLECQYLGPTLKFQRDTVIAVTGADMQPKLDGQPVPLWESIPVKAGQTLASGPALGGAGA